MNIASDPPSSLAKLFFFQDLVETLAIKERDMLKVINASGLKGRFVDTDFSLRNRGLHGIG